MSRFVFNPADFKSIHVEITLSNLTSKSPVRGTCALLELSDSGAVLSVPRASCALGHQLSVQFVVGDAPSAIKLETTAKALEVESENGQDAKHEFDRVSLQFVQYDLERMNQFREVFSKRQREINHFFRSVKGEG